MSKLGRMALWVRTPWLIIWSPLIMVLMSLFLLSFHFNLHQRKFISLHHMKQHFYNFLSLFSCKYWTEIFLTSLILFLGIIMKFRKFSKCSSQFGIRELKQKCHFSIWFGLRRRGKRKKKDGRKWCRERERERERDDRST